MVQFPEYHLMHRLLILRYISRGKTRIKYEKFELHKHWLHVNKERKKINDTRHKKGKKPFCFEKLCDLR